MSKNTPKVLIYSVLFSIFLFASCQEDNLMKDSKDERSSLSQSSFALKMDYEVESVSYQQVVENANANEKLQFIDQARALPVITRQKVSVEVFHDGSSTWEIVQQTPKNPVPQRGAEVPPDNSVKTVTTKVIDNMGYFYDAKGKLIRTHEIQIPSFSGLLEAIKDTCGRVRKAHATVMIQNPRAALSSSCTRERAAEAGATITELSENILSIRQKVEFPIVADNPSAKTTGKSDMYSVDLVDTERSLLLGTRLYDENDKLIMVQMYKYTDSELPELEVMRQEVYEYSDLTKTAHLVISDFLFENFNFENNITD